MCFGRPSLLLQGSLIAWKEAIRALQAHTSKPERSPNTVVPAYTSPLIPEHHMVHCAQISFRMNFSAHLRATLAYNL